VCHPAGSLSGTRLPSRFLFFPFFFVVARLKKEKGEKRTKRNNRGNRGYAHIFLLALVFHLSAIQSPGDPPKMEIILLTSFFQMESRFSDVNSIKTISPLGCCCCCRPMCFLGGRDERGRVAVGP
jgi:hypothetical protein